MIPMILFLAAKSKETICFGPLCPQLTATGADNSSVGGLIGSTLGKLINMAIIVAGLFMLFYLLWGGLDWIMSEGDKDKIAKAQKKITNAVIGVLIVVISLTIFGTISGDILGIVKKTDTGGWIFVLPTLQ
jgi:hypothetical protein